MPHPDFSKQAIIDRLEALESASPSGGAEQKAGAFSIVGDGTPIGVVAVDFEGDDFSAADYGISLIIDKDASTVADWTSLFLEAPILTAPLVSGFSLDYGTSASIQVGDTLVLRYVAARSA